jgi:predicted phage tail protein
MIQVHLHGILGNKYGKIHKFAAKSPKDILNALEANYSEFRRDLKDLALKNIHYTCVTNGKWLKNGKFCDEKIQKLDFVPMILGSGPIAGTSITWLMVASFVLAVGSAVYSFVQAGKMEFPEVPGSTGTSTALNRSLAFSNRENIIEQGNPVPLVYGRIKVGSFVIQSSIKTFPLSLTLTDEFVNTTSKKSNNQTAVIDGSNSELTSVTQNFTLDPSRK